MMDATVLGERSGDTDRATAQGDRRGRSHSRRSGKLPQLRVTDGNARLETAWTVVYYAILFSGVLAFWKGFWVLTRAEGGLVDWNGA